MEFRELFETISNKLKPYKTLITMDINFHPIIGLILIAGVLQGLLMGGIFVFKTTGHKKANICFGLLTVVFSLALVHNFFIHQKFYEAYAQYQFLPIWYSLSLGMLLFFFVKYTLFPTYKLRRSDSKHFILPIWQASFYWFMFFQSTDYKQTVLDNFMPIYQVIQGILFIATFFGYLLLAYRYIKYKKGILQKKKGFDWEIKQVDWVRRVLKMLFLLGCLNTSYVVANFFWQYFTGNSLFDIPFFFYLVNLSFAAMIFWLGLFGYNHTFWFISDNRQYQEAISKNKYQANQLTPVQIQQLIKNIRDEVAQRQLYRNADLNIERLAQETAIDIKTLKVVFQKGFQQTFWEWITAYRLAEARK